MIRKHINSWSTALKRKLSIFFVAEKNTNGRGAFQGQKYTTVEDLETRHPRDAKKVPVTETDCLRECKSTVACITGALWAKRGERGILLEPRDEGRRKK